MPTELSRQDKMKDAFLVLGSQYFAHARYSSQFITEFPVCATLFHISIEMLLKGFLIQKLSSDNLKKIGHKLIKLWELFKSYEKNDQLTCLDSTIAELDKVEDIRYPDAIVDKRYALHVSQGSPAMPFYLPGMEDVPNYYINVSDLDAIATMIFDACKVNPKIYFKNALIVFQTALPSNFRILRE